MLYHVSIEVKITGLSIDVFLTFARSRAVDYYEVWEYIEGVSAIIVETLNS